MVSQLHELRHRFDGGSVTQEVQSGDASLYAAPQSSVL
jgi:hypothetical protein